MKGIRSEIFAALRFFSSTKTRASSAAQLQLWARNHAIQEYDDLLVLREDVQAIQSGVVEPQSVHLLPYFDVYLLAHRLKEHFLKAQFYKRVFRDQAWISPVVLINGQIAGVWSYKLSRREIVVEVELFSKIPRNARTQIANRAEELAKLFRRPLSLSFKT